MHSKHQANKAINTYTCTHGKSGCLYILLNAIDWANLKQAHGTSAHVPDALRGLVSDDPEIQKSAYWKLDNFIVLQSDLFESAYFVVPFLVEILTSQPQTDLRYIYDLLFEIGNGSAPESQRCYHKGVSLSLKAACRQAVADAVNVYLSEVGNLQSKYRLNALDLLVSWHEFKHGILPTLERLYRIEQGSDFGAELKRAISDLQ